MINKSNLWFLTLSSIILVLAIYYIAIPGDTVQSVFSANENNNSVVTSIEESEIITAMRVSKEEELLESMQNLQEILLSDSSTIEEKNDAYEQIQHLNSNKASEEKLESIINDTYSVKSFVQIKDTTIKVVIANKDDSYELANNIINTVNSELDGTYYVTVKFE